MKVSVSYLQLTVLSQNARSKVTLLRILKVAAIPSSNICSCRSELHWCSPFCSLLVIFSPVSKSLLLQVSCNFTMAWCPSVLGNFLLLLISLHLCFLSPLWNSSYVDIFTHIVDWTWSLLAALDCEHQQAGLLCFCLAMSLQEPNKHWTNEGMDEQMSYFVLPRVLC